MTSFDFHGIDAGWLAMDSLRQVAVFTTGGAGPIPVSAQASSPDVEQLVRSLAEISECELLADINRPDDFLAFAKRGLFSYDWSDVHRTQSNCVGGYELQARPVRPLTIEQLPKALQLIATATKLEAVVFGIRRIHLDA